MNAVDTIGHDGIVERILNDIAFISFQQSSGCSGCSIRTSCGMAESDDKILKIPIKGTRVAEGDKVIVTISKRDGHRAVLVSYFIPFLIVVVVLALMLQLQMPEPMAGVISLLALIPYYGALKIFNRFFKNDLSFEVQKR